MSGGDWNIYIYTDKKREKKNCLCIYILYTQTKGDENTHTHRLADRQIEKGKEGTQIEYDLNRGIKSVSDESKYLPEHNVRPAKSKVKQKGTTGESRIAPKIIQEINPISFFVL